MSVTRELTTDEKQWLTVRKHLVEHRFDLAVSAAADYPADRKVAGTPLLAPSTWVPAEPIPLDTIELDFQPETEFHGVTGDEAPDLLPSRGNGAHYQRYSEVVGALAAPSVFENRSTYRLLSANLSGPDARLQFGKGTYFDGLDTGEAAAHEYAARSLNGDLPSGLRSLIGDPCDLERRPVNMAISTLTVRLDRSSGDASFLVHWRDPAKVGHAGGLYQVVPVGVFQASGEAEWNEHNDFSLWRSMLREFSEELRGTSEDYDSDRAPIDYAAWPFAARMTNAVQDREVRAFCLGLGVDPLTFATDLLTVVIIDAPLYDELFGARVSSNAEGRVLDAKPFDEATVEHLVSVEPMQAAGAALLRLAWQQRSALL